MRLTFSCLTSIETSTDLVNDGVSKIVVWYGTETIYYTHSKVKIPSFKFLVSYLCVKPHTFLSLIAAVTFPWLSGRQNCLMKSYSSSLRSIYFNMLSEFGTYGNMIIIGLV